MAIAGDLKVLYGLIKPKRRWGLAHVTLFECVPHCSTVLNLQDVSQAEGKAQALKPKDLSLNPSSLTGYCH